MTRPNNLKEHKRINRKYNEYAGVLTEKCVEVPIGGRRFSDTSSSNVQTGRKQKPSSRLRGLSVNREKSSKNVEC